MPKHKYVVESVIETDVEVTRKAVREECEDVLQLIRWLPDRKGNQVAVTKARVRKVDLD